MERAEKYAHLSDRELKEAAFDEIVRQLQFMADRHPGHSERYFAEIAKRPKLWSAGQSPTPPPIQNRACEFPSTRLLNTRAVDISTISREACRDSDRVAVPN